MALPESYGGLGTGMGDQIGPAGAFEQKGTVSPNKKTRSWSNNWILISEMSFLVNFRPEMAFERTIRLTYVF